MATLVDPITITSMEYTAVYLRNVRSEQIGDELLCDPEYPGYFCIVNYPQGTTNKIVFISDPDVAFMLKMRLG